MQPDLTNNPVPESIAVIKKVHELTAHYWLKTKLGNGLLIVAEMACYLLVIGLVMVAILMPNGTIPLAKWVSDGYSRELNFKMDEIICFFTILKVIVGVLGLLMFVPARLFRKLRKKNNVMEEVNTICGEYLGKAI
jgi:hypothetical protein